MPCKVVLIGGGSYNWTPTLAKDLFLREGLRGSQLVLDDGGRIELLGQQDAPAPPEFTRGFVRSAAANP